MRMIEKDDNTSQSWDDVANRKFATTQEDFVVGVSSLPNANKWYFVLSLLLLCFLCFDIWDASQLPATLVELEFVHRLKAIVWIILTIALRNI